MTTATASPKEIALNRSAQAPDWVQLLPAGPVVMGRDGRRWTLSNPQAVAEKFEGPIPLDFEHSTYIRAPKGERADAAGWIEQLEVRDGAIWGRVDWNEAGREAVQSRGYRFISPGFRFGKETGEISALIHAGLVNTPNLDLTALNRKEAPPSMTLNEQLRKALGLKEDATDQEILSAVNSTQQNQPEKTEFIDQVRDALGLNKEDDEKKVLEAVNSLQSGNGQGKSNGESVAVPDLDQYVPRGDYNTAVNRAHSAENQLAQIRKEKEDEAINAALDQAIEDGKVLPASRDFYEAACRADGGLEKFKAFAEQAPAMAEDGDKGKATAVNKSGQLNDEEVAMCRQMGLSHEAYLESRDGESDGAAASTQTTKKEDA